MRRLAWVGSTLWLALAPCRGSAQAPLLSGLGGPAGFGAGVLAAADDGSSAAIPLATAFPGGLSFAGAPRSEVYVNTNGNITFGGPLPGHTPVGFPVASRPMIAPFYGDVDTRAALSGGRNGVYWSVEPGRFVATYYDVGYYEQRTNRLNAFQVVLTAPGGSVGDFDVELRYNRCEWTTGDASGGTGGLGGTETQAGFDAGNSLDYHVLPGSGTSAVLAYCATSNVGVAGVWRFQIRGGFVAISCGNGILESGEACDDGNRVALDGCSVACATERLAGSACTTGSECATGFCADGVCCNGGCGGQCEACDLPSSVGTCAAVRGPPRGARPACGGSGACGATCDGTNRAECAFPGASVACEDGVFCTVDDACDGGGGCIPGVPRACGDGDACTTDVCDLTTDTCSHAYTGGCSIGGACLAPGAVDPTNPCRACQPLFSRTEHTLREVGASCEDGLFCTSGDTCGSTGLCTPGGVRDCGDGVSCTIDTCDEDANVCTSSPGPDCLFDAGTAADAGEPIGVDAGQDDAGAGATDLDGSIGVDAGVTAESPTGGCSCRAGGDRSARASLVAFGLTAAWLARRRRR